jgi:hypothetical protein
VGAVSEDVGSVGIGGTIEFLELGKGHNWTADCFFFAEEETGKLNSRGEPWNRERRERGEKIEIFSA